MGRIYNSYLSFDMTTDVEKSLAFKKKIQSIQSGVGGDALGQMTMSELGQFQTTWCYKRYNHDATPCRFAHIDVNKEWLRRDPSQIDYYVTLCPNTKILNHKISILDWCYVNACAYGLLYTVNSPILKKKWVTIRKTVRRRCVNHHGRGVTVPVICGIYVLIYTKVVTPVVVPRRRLHDRWRGIVDDVVLMTCTLVSSI